MLVTPAWCATMARYNMWQNRNVVGAADGLDGDARTQERGSFFGTIAGTLSHLLWADLVWMARFTGGERPVGGIRGSAGLFDDWPDYKESRAATDDRILGWTDGLTPEAVTGDLTWRSDAAGREVVRPLGLCIAHFFNHQTHHRGQVHAMLTAAGAAPGDTDLFLMPEKVRL